MPPSPLYANSGAVGELMLTSAGFTLSEGEKSNILVIDFRTPTECYFTQSGAVANLSFVNLGGVTIQNKNLIKFISSVNSNGIFTTCSTTNASVSTDVPTTLSLDPCKCNGKEYLMNSIGVFLEDLASVAIGQTIIPEATSRTPLHLYLETLNTSIYSEIAADLNLKPTTENAVATLYLSPSTADDIFKKTDATITVNTDKLKTAFGASAFDKFVITYSDLFPTVSYPNSNPNDNVIIDLHRYLNKVALPNRTLLLNEKPISVFANPAVLIQDHFNLGCQLTDYICQKTTGNLYSTVTDALGGGVFNGFLSGDSIQWKVTVYVQLDLPVPLAPLSSNNFAKRIYLFKINVTSDTNLINKTVNSTYYPSLVSEDDTATGIFNSGSSSTYNYPWHYVDLSTSQYLSTNVTSAPDNYSRKVTYSGNVIGQPS